MRIGRRGNAQAAVLEHEPCPAAAELIPGDRNELLLEGFRNAEKAVLLGTRAFWEDVDLSPDDLVALVIVRLPFAVPSDPIFAGCDPLSSLLASSARRGRSLSFNLSKGRTAPVMLLQ